jgi:hypothetical protein
LVRGLLKIYTCQSIVLNKVFVLGTNISNTIS